MRNRAPCTLAALVVDAVVPQFGAGRSEVADKSMLAIIRNAQLAFHERGRCAKCDG
jgi:hypothetical protein